MAQSDSVVSLHDPFELIPLTDIDNNGVVDGADLAAIVQLIQDGAIDDVDWVVQLIAQRFGLLQ